MWLIIYSEVNLKMISLTIIASQVKNTWLSKKQMIRYLIYDISFHIQRNTIFFGSDKETQFDGTQISTKFFKK